MPATRLSRRALIAGACGLGGCAWRPEPQRFSAFGTIDELTGLSLAPAGDLLALSTLAGDICVFDASTLKPRSNKLARGTDELLGFALSHDSLVVVLSSAAPSASSTRGHDRRSRVIVDDLASGQGGDVLSLDGRVAKMRVARFGKHAIFATLPADVSVVDLGTAATVARWSGVAATDVAISGRGEQIAWATAGGGISIGSPSSRELRTLETKAPVSALQFAEHGRALYAVAGEGLVRFDIETAQPETFPLPGSAAAFVAAADGSVAIVNDSGFSVLAGSDRRQGPPASPGDPPRFLAYDPGHRRVFVASRARVMVYETERMTQVGVIADTLSDIARANG